jgi:hypothetical protein
VSSGCCESRADGSLASLEESLIGERAYSLHEGLERVEPCYEISHCVANSGENGSCNAHSLLGRGSGHGASIKVSGSALPLATTRDRCTAGVFSFGGAP